MGSRRFGSIRFAVYPNDHEPPHVHAYSGGATVIVDLPEDGTVRLSRRKRAIRDATASTVRKVLDAAQANFDELMSFGRNIMAVQIGDKQIQAAISRSKREMKDEIVATDVRYIPRVDAFELVLSNGTRAIYPREQLQGLQRGTRKQFSNVELVGGGSGLHWPDLDADLLVEGLLHGVYGTKQWMSQLGRIGGSVRSKAKTEAARRNGLKGGRPAVPALR